MSHGKRAQKLAHAWGAMVVFKKRVEGWMVSHDRDTKGKTTPIGSRQWYSQFFQVACPPTQHTYSIHLVPHGANEKQST
jgi:hypothetical protein